MMATTLIRSSNERIYTENIEEARNKDRYRDLVEAINGLNEV